MNEDTRELAAILRRLDTLEAKEQIRNLVSRHSRGVDRVDPSVIASIYWPDARFALRGVEKPFVEHVVGENIADYMGATHHLMGNMIIDLDLENDRAYVETYAIAHHRSRPTFESNAAVVGADNIPNGSANDVLELIVGVRYLDVMKRREGIWKIGERRLVFDWSQLRRYSGIEAGGLYEVTSYRGAQGHADPSYERPGAKDSG
jgi:SnoaL-like domain